MEKVLSSEFNLKEDIKCIIKPFCFKGAQKGIDVWLYFKQSIDEVLLGDSTKLNQKIISLLENAIKYTDKGYVLLIIKQIEYSNTRVKLEFAVYDTGLYRDINTIVGNGIGYENVIGVGNKLYFTIEFDRK